MKFVIENYSNNKTTQPLYLHTGLDNQENISATLYENNTRSLFDMLDSTNPEYFITHASLLKRDHIEYCKQNNNIKLIISVQNLQKKDIQNLDQVLHDNDINCPILFLNSNVIPKIKHRNIIRLMDCADSNLSKQKAIVNYKLNRAYVVDQVHNIEDKTPYHVLSTNMELKDKVDICLPEIHLSALYSKYDEIIFLDIKDNVPQSFFDAILLGNKVIYKSDDSDTNTMIENIFKHLTPRNINECNFQELKQLVEEKHTEKNRVKTLISQLPKA